MLSKIPNKNHVIVVTENEVTVALMRVLLLTVL